MFTSHEIREKFLSFMKSKGHTIIPSSSLIPENDPSVLFTSAGMQPLVPYIMGEKYPGGNRLADVQKCIRTVDIEDVGDTCHHTFFEMLGNWSLGDYFKEESIKNSWEFLTSEEGLGLDRNRIAVSVFEGDEDSPFDAESHETWKKLGMLEERIAKLPKTNNWWGMKRGPCGPDTEIFYWVGDPQNVPDILNTGNKHWVEIWNNIFIQYNKIHNDGYEPLKQKNVDTGMGLERILAAVNGFDDNYRTDLFWPIIEKIQDISGKKYGEDKTTTRAIRIIVDHLKAATFIMADNKDISPSNLGQGYVVRRLIRRSIRYGMILGIKNDSWTKEIAKIVAFMFNDAYSELPRNIDKVVLKFEEEENKFKKTLENGLKVFEKALDWHLKDGIVSWNMSHLNGELVFDLYSTYGFPKELIREVAEEKEILIPAAVWEEADRLFKEHQEKSRTASQGMFKGGLADSSEESKRLHTAAHLLLAALRKMFGDHVFQKGSNITPERLRFDFSYSEKMTEEQIREAEEIVNEQIRNNLPVTFEEMSLDEAVKQNAMGVFKAKYGEQVKVYTIADVSKEICGGPHVERTGELGHFKIVKEESSSAGVRRIKAILK
jgi:alanyl-tRNA synthetase